MKIGDINFSFKKGFEILNKEAVKTENVTNTIVERQLFRLNSNLGVWRAAQSYAEDVHNPNRIELMRVYQETIIDSHLSSVINSRTEKVLSHKFHLVDDKGDVNEDATKLLQKSWFIKFMDLAMQSKWYGYSLIQFDNLNNNIFEDIDLIPREYIEPSLNIVKKEPYVLDGLDYTAEPVSNWTFFVGSEDLGLLDKLTPLAIWKKNALGGWAEFIDMFGIPPRIGRTNTSDPKAKQNMFDMLKNMGRMSFGVFGENDKIELVETKGSGDPYQVFDKLIERTNSEMSKLITGGTMTADDGSSRSQAEVHERGFDVISTADLRWFEALMNEQFIKWMIKNHDFKLEGLTFKFDQTESLSLTDQKDIIEVLLDKYTIPADWIHERFGIPVEEIKTETQEDPESFFFEQIKQVYKPSNHNCINDEIINAADPSPILTKKEEAELYEFIYKEIFSVDNLPKKMYMGTKETLEDAMTEGFGGGLEDFKPTTKEYKTIQSLTDDIGKFAANKTFQNVAEMQSLLRDSKGVLKTFSEFKKDAGSVFKTYNKHYLKTEFNTALANSQSAERWLSLQANKDITPNVRYRTLGDGRVRDSHAALDGIVYSLEGSDLGSVAPANDWNCRCYLEPTSAKVTDPEKTEKKDPEKTGFIPAKTLKEAESRINKLGVKNVDLKGLKKDDFNAVLESMTTQSKYKSFELDRLHTYRKSDSTFRAVYSPSNNSIGLNLSNMRKIALQGAPKSFAIQKQGLTQSLKDWKKVIPKYDTAIKNKKNIIGRRKAVARINSLERRIKKIDDKIKNKETPLNWSIPSSMKTRGESINATITHEMGHYRDYKQLRGSGQHFSFKPSDAVSDYGKTDKEEYFAEGYANYFHGKKGNTPTQLLNIFELWK